jgi:hypothetical protein
MTFRCTSYDSGVHAYIAGIATSAMLQCNDDATEYLQDFGDFSKIWAFCPRHAGFDSGFEWRNRLVSISHDEYCIYFVMDC